MDEMKFVCMHLTIINNADFTPEVDCQQQLVAGVIKGHFGITKQNYSYTISSCSGADTRLLNSTLAKYINRYSLMWQPGDGATCK